jgi:hypothetical protein
MTQCLSFIAVLGIGLPAASTVARAQQSQVDAVSSGVAKLEEEVAAYREALKELTRPLSHGRCVIGFHNARRPHSSLDRKTPNQAYFNRLM